MTVQDGDGASPPVYPTRMLNARVLGQLSLMQSIVASLPDERSMFGFVCRGLLDVPGVARVRHAERDAASAELANRRFPLVVGNIDRGELLIELSDADAFAPYHDYLKNFAFMLAVILEERSQRRQIEAHQDELEQRVHEQTRQLREEIAERQRTEDALRSSETVLRLAFEHATAGICLVDADGRFLRVNPTLCAMLGYEKHVLEQRTVHDVTHPDDLPLGVAFMARALAGKEASASIEKRYLHREGHVVWAWVSSAIVRSPHEPPYFVTYVQDITERRRAEDDLRRARDEAEAANRTKDEFLATVSHELRTPLGPILAWAQMLREGGLAPAEVNDALASIERNARMQAQLIEDLLDVARIVAGKLRLQVRRCTLAPIIRAAMEAVEPAASAKGVHMETSIAERIGAIRADPERMQQVVWNLLANAIKFTPAGGRVRLSVARSGPHVVVVVADTGQGIGADLLPYLFMRFQQGQDATTRSYGGLGLGLALVRHLVELHGGRVRAESDGQGRGATFTVEMPVLVEADLDVPQPTRIIPR